MGEPFISQNIGEDKKKGLCLPISGFLVSKEKKNIWCHHKMVTPGAGRPPSDATKPHLVGPLRMNRIKLAETNKGYAFSLTVGRRI